ncbi:MAG: YHS domain-containing protein [Acidimicrobiia bacterium]|nr:YHS domain-containing protein [Acidimicrobiia bacterium]
MVAGRAGGIPLQIPEECGGFLVDSVEECAEQTLRLLRNPDQAELLGNCGRQHVRERFLLTRLLSDELRLYSLLLERGPAFAHAAASGLDGEVRDPVCGIIVDPAEAWRATWRGGEHLFCSPTCRREFLADPDRFLRGTVRTG